MPGAVAMIGVNVSVIVIVPVGVPLPAVTSVPTEITMGLVAILAGSIEVAVGATVIAVGAAVTVIIGAFVRQYVAFKSLREKIKLIEIFKQHVLEAASGPNDGATLSRIALDGDAVRFVLNDKDYGNLAKYLEPALVLDVLRTVAAIDEVASVVKEATSAKTAAAIPKYALSQLERFNQQEILRQLVQPFLLGRASSDSAVDSQVQKLGSDE